MLGMTSMQVEVAAVGVAFEDLTLERESEAVVEVVWGGSLKMVRCRVDGGCGQLLGGAVRVQGPGSLLANDSTLTSMEGSGLVVGANLGYGSAVLQRCTVSDNEEKGIRVGKRGRVHAENCQVDRNEEFNISVVG